MYKTDLQKEFVKALLRKVPKRAQLVNLLSDILHIEKEPASRRLSGKVLFTIHEMTALARTFHISIDPLIHQKEDSLRIPLQLTSPMKIQSMDSLSTMIEANFEYMRKIGERKAESGHVYSTMPIEFFLSYPTLSKFMFFKWGHYFIGTEEFDNFSEWNIPVGLTKLHEKFALIREYESTFYIWDSSLIWTLVGEIDMFYKMHVITTEEKDILKDQLKELLSRLEDFLKGVEMSEMYTNRDVRFYVSNLSLGFTCINSASEELTQTVFQTNFTYSQVDNCHETYKAIKEWMKSLQSISVLMSKSARVERRLFFEKQYKIIDLILD